jgi:phosphate starvation-inducible PhoH-like protein
VEAIKVVGGIEGIAFVRFDERDVVRHKLVQQIVKAYDAYTSGPSERGASSRTAGPQGENDGRDERSRGDHGS